jgi:carbonic anhydrase
MSFLGGVRSLRGISSKLCLAQRTTARTPYNTQHFLRTFHWTHFIPKQQQEEKDEDPALEQLLSANKDWRERKAREDPTFFTELGKGQSPDFLYIGCSDSRVAVSDLTGVELGKLFVHRNIANLVVASDMNLLSVLTYAVEHLKVKHILVTGHYDCGGVRAAAKKQDLGILDAWLQNIRDVYRLHKDELDAIEGAEDRHRRLVELNVVEQCLNLYKTSVVQKQRIETHADSDEPFAYPRIHGLVFDPATGELQKIPIDFRSKISELREMYDLFDVDTVGPHYMLKKEDPTTNKEE